MKKRFLSILLCTSMAAAMLTGCGGKEKDDDAAVDTNAGTGTEENDGAGADTDAPADDNTDNAPVEAEAIPEPAYYFSFDEADGTDGITPTGQDTTATPILFPVEKEVKFIPGVKGEAVYIDGTYGLKLDVNGVGDTYSVSYWLYATRYANYMPTLQFGPDIHGDATGGQHYLNITRTEWPGEPTFPCIWSYDQNNGELWPAWSPDETGEHMKEWMNITLVVDPAKVSEDGTCIVPELYINGELYQGSAPINIVTGTMAPSDNFDFLLGINYWDAIFKGAFDEVYVFDTTLTAGQAKALYEAGDPTVAFEEPERIVEVKVDENAMEAIGSTELNTPFWTDWTSAFELADGQTKEVVLNNFSDGVNAWDNYVLVFTNEPSEAHVDPNSSTTGEHREWAAVRADAFGWTPEGDIPAESFTYNWGNWATWSSQAMVDADVTLTINREGDTLNITAKNVDYNGTSNDMTATVKTALTPEDPCYFLFTCENSYVELMSVKDAIDVVADPNALETLGNTTYGLAWWTEFTNSVELADGATKKVVLNNYSDGVNNWDNFVVAFTNTNTEAGTAPSADNYEGYAEYAVIRADAYGWGDASYAGTFETSWGDDWAGWLQAMMDAEVTLEITRNGGEIVMDTTIVDRDGNTLTNHATITSTLTADDPCYFFITGEASYIEVLSVE